jgi:hypothetical protein
MDVVPGSVELYVLALMVSSVWVGVSAPPLPRGGAFIGVGFFLAITLFFAVAQLFSERKFRQFLVQVAFIAVPAALMVLWIQHR